MRERRGSDRKWAVGGTEESSKALKRPRMGAPGENVTDSDQRKGHLNIV